MEETLFQIARCTHTQTHIESLTTTIMLRKKIFRKRKFFIFFVRTDFMFNKYSNTLLLEVGWTN